MKKLGKNLNYFMKVFLAVGLLFSNLSSLTVVFAYEGEDETINSEVANETLNDEDNNVEEIVDTTEENNEEVLDDTLTNEENIENKEDEVVQDETTDSTVDEAIEETNETTEEKTNIEGTTEENTNEEATYVEYDYTAMLNESAEKLELDKAYLFKEIDNEKKLYVILGVNDSEVNQIVANAFEDVTCEIVEDKIILTRGEEEIIYQTSIYDEDYLSELIKTAIGNEDTTTEVIDVNEDGKIDTLDVVILNNILKNGFADYEIEKNDDKIDSRLDAYVGASKVDGEVSVSTGDEFTVEYILTLSKNAVDTVTGTINYNKDLLSLENVQATDLLTGEVYEGKYIYLGDYIVGNAEYNEETLELEYQDTDYVIITMTFKALSSGSDTISIDDLGYYYEDTYYEGNDINDVMVVVLSSDNSLSSLKVAGEEIQLQEGTFEYEITVNEDVTLANVVALVSEESGAVITSIVAPEELAIGENEITIEVTAENGVSQVYTIKVIRGEVSSKEEEKSQETSGIVPVSYNEDTGSNTEPEIVPTPEDEEKTVPENKATEKDNDKLSRIVIVVLILLALAGLIYLIFKDDDEETKKANKDIDRLKKDDIAKEKNKNSTNRKVDKNHKKGR